MCKIVSALLITAILLLVGCSAADDNNTQQDTQGNTPSEQEVTEQETTYTIFPDCLTSYDSMQDYTLEYGSTSLPEMDNPEIAIGEMSTLLPFELSEMGEWEDYTSVTVMPAYNLDTFVFSEFVSIEAYDYSFDFEESEASSIKQVMRITFEDEDSAFPIAYSVCHKVLENVESAVFDIGGVEFDIDKLESLFDNWNTEATFGVTWNFIAEDGGEVCCQIDYDGRFYIGASYSNYVRN